MDAMMWSMFALGLSSFSLGLNIGLMLGRSERKGGERPKAEEADAKGGAAQG